MTVFNMSRSTVSQKQAMVLVNNFPSHMFESKVKACKSLIEKNRFDLFDQKCPSQHSLAPARKVPWFDDFNATFINMIEFLSVSFHHDF